MQPKNEKLLEEYRVAQAELSSGNTNGNVYMQLSPGAGLFLTDRIIAVENISNRIRSICNDGVMDYLNHQRGDM